MVILYIIFKGHMAAVILALGDYYGYLISIKRHKSGWGDSSVGRVLALQA